MEFGVADRSHNGSSIFATTVKFKKINEFELSRQYTRKLKQEEKLLVRLNI